MSAEAPTRAALTNILQAPLSSPQKPTIKREPSPDDASLALQLPPDSLSPIKDLKPHLIPALPVEIYLLIITIATESLVQLARTTDNSACFVPVHAFLRSASLVNSTFGRQAQDHLLRSALVTYKNYTTFVERVKARGEYFVSQLKAVRVANFDDDEWDEEEMIYSYYGARPDHRYMQQTNRRRKDLSPLIRYLVAELPGLNEVELFRTATRGASSRDTARW